MNLFTEIGLELLALVNGLSLPVKVGWPLLVVWAIAQVMWFRRVREDVPPPPRTVTKPARSPRQATRTAPSSVHAGSPEFLSALGIDPNPPSR